MRGMSGEYRLTITQGEKVGDRPLAALYSPRACESRSRSRTGAWTAAWKTPRRAGRAAVSVVTSPKAAPGGVIVRTTATVLLAAAVVLAIAGVTGRPHGGRWRPRARVRRG